MLVNGELTGVNKNTGSTDYMSDAKVDNREIGQLFQGNGPHTGYYTMSKDGNSTTALWKGDVTTVLAEDGESCAIRMGGEEFLLLLRGPVAAERAERLRRALSTRIASAVPGLGHLVTASMGLVEHDLAGKLDVEFAVLYSHCDRLLYEAKRLGRNRTMHERLTGFTPDLQVRSA